VFIEEHDSEEEQSPELKPKKRQLKEEEGIDIRLISMNYSVSYNFELMGE
jgi:hypothetical protein